MMHSNYTLKDLLKDWQFDLQSLDDTNDEKVAYSMVGRLAAVDQDNFKNLYDKNKTVAAIFDLAGDLEVPPTAHIGVGDRLAAWREIHRLMDVLRSEVDRYG